jgi:hypothetical protein
MSYPEQAIVQQGRDAWRRLQQSQRTSWQDWVRVGHALLVGRRDAMLTAKANSPFGVPYNKAFGAFLRDNGFDAISGQDRYKIIQCLEHEIEIEQWRATLDEKQRLRLNHPSAVWAHFTKAFRPGRQVEPRLRNTVRAKTTPHKGRPIYWSQDILRAAAEGIRMANSNDIYKVALAALNAAFPTRDSLIEAADDPRPHTRADRIAQLEAATV